MSWIIRIFLMVVDRLVVWQEHECRIRRSIRPPVAMSFALVTGSGRGPRNENRHIGGYFSCANSATGGVTRPWRSLRRRGDGSKRLPDVGRRICFGQLLQRQAARFGCDWWWYGTMLCVNDDAMNCYRYCTAACYFCCCSCRRCTFDSLNTNRRHVADAFAISRNGFLTDPTCHFGS